MAYYLALDIGGTNLKAGLTNDRYEILDKAYTKTLADRRSGREIMAACIELCQSLMRRADLTAEQISAIGIGAPGTVDDSKGELRHASNLDLNLCPAREIFQEQFNCPIHVVNDANAAALAEARMGAGRGVKDSVLITIGTGIGGGLVLNGSLYSGFNDAASELGHHVIVVDGRPCTCGRKGCLEQYVSAAALVRDTEELVAQEPNSIIAKIAQEDGKVSGRTLFAALRENCQEAEKLSERYFNYLAEGIGNVVNFLMPELVIIGGGISHEGERIPRELNRRLPEKTFSLYSRAQTRVVLAELGNDAGLIGAAIYAREEADKVQ
ncbi:MAG: ROK family protein [Eubacteriales bacterium]|nr:ROK family protein [Eubacteriales bacterium]